MTPTILIALLSLALLISFLVNLSQMQANKHLLEDWAAEKVKRHSAELACDFSRDTKIGGLSSHKFKIEDAPGKEILRAEKLPPDPVYAPSYSSGTTQPYDPDDNPPLESRFEAKLRKSK